MKTEESFTKYEIARILGARALQLTMDAPILIDLDKEKLEEIGYDPLKIAELEFNSRVLPITVKRPVPKKTAEKIKKAEKKVEKEEKVEEVKEEKPEEEARKQEVELRKEVAEIVKGRHEIMELVTPEDEIEEAEEPSESSEE